jgi:pyrroloquinoline-quinone synthase
MGDGMAGAWDREGFLEELRAVGRARYHDRHPFHCRMNEGQLAPDELRCWVVNRFYYQRNLPQKDAAIIANCPVAEVRRAWLRRLIDQDGVEDGGGGIAAWLRLAAAVGLTTEETLDERHVKPGVRFAVDAYLHFARTHPWPVAVASSLTELFAPDLMAERLRAFERYYPWIDPSGLDYFRRRPEQARRDATYGLSVTLDYCTTPDLQRQAVQALAFKCDVLWALLDAVAHGSAAGGSDHG